MERAAPGKRDSRIRLTALGVVLALALVVPSPALAADSGGGTPAAGTPTADASRNGDGDGHDSNRDGDHRGDGHGDNGSSSQGLVWPTPGHVILSPFGENRGDHFHSGLDISAPIGTPTRAAGSGRVIFVGSEGGYGNFVCIAHSALSTCYAHLSAFRVRLGQAVNQSDVIGLSGCTGNCSGPHVHFEVRMGTRMWAAPTDPARYLPGARVTSPTGPITRAPGD